MNLNNRFYECFKERAAEITIKNLTFGLGYTSVTTSNNETGICYTYFDSKKGCSMISKFKNYESESGLNLLEEIKGKDTILRSGAIALINALNYNNAITLPEDSDNSVLMKEVAPVEGSKVCMAGYFHPIVKMLEERKAIVEIFDISKKIGDEKDFYNKLEKWADSFILTSTSLINGTAEGILAKTRKDCKTVLLGPSTPMVKEPFENYNISMLCGFVPSNSAMVLTSVRQGAGTMALNKWGKKSYLAFF